MHKVAPHKIAAILMITLLMRAAFADTTSPTDNLSSQDYAERQQALKTIKASLIAQQTALLKTDDAEALATVTQTLQFDQRLTIWLTKLTTLPAADRTAQLQLLNTPTLLPLLTNYFSPDTQSRIDSIHQLATAKNIDATTLLLNALRDDAPQVSFAVMELFWDRPATPDVLDALWQLGMRESFDLVLRPMHHRAPTEKFTYRDQTVTADAPTPVVLRGLDLRMKAARELLAHFKGSQVDSLTIATLADIAKRLHQPQGISIRRISEALATLTAFAVENNSRAAIPVLHDFLAIPTTGLDEEFLATTGATSCTRYYSVHTDALAAIVQLTGQKPADFALFKPDGATGWTSTGQNDEAAAVDRMNDWWKTHAVDFPAAPAASPASANAN